MTLFHLILSRIWIGGPILCHLKTMLFEYGIKGCRKGLINVSGWLRSSQQPRNKNLMGLELPRIFRKHNQTTEINLVKSLLWTIKSATYSFYCACWNWSEGDAMISADLPTFSWRTFKVYKDRNTWSWILHPPKDFL